MKKNLIVEKTYTFAVKIIGIHHLLIKQKEWDIASQLLRSGTSVGANVEEAVGSQSRRDFLAKISIAYKESRETHYWLRLLIDGKIIEEQKLAQIIQDCIEIKKILASIQKTLKESPPSLSPPKP